MEGGTSISKITSQKLGGKNLVGGNFIIANTTGTIKARKIHWLIFHCFTVHFSIQ